MRRLISVLLIVLSFVMAKSQITKPDFAFPKTTAQNAEKTLKSAVANKDANKAINALIVYTLAETAIDDDELQNVIKLVEETETEFAASSLHGIFDALLARLYAGAYTENRWVYDNRELPLEPLPKDITEWSGAQYKAKITELCLKSISGTNIEKLMSLNILDFPDIVICTKESAVYFPTMADFAYQNAVDLLQNYVHYKDLDDIIHQAMDGAKSVAAKIQWSCQSDCLKEDQFDALKADYEKYRDNVHSGLIIGKMNGFLGDWDKKTCFREIATEYLAKFPVDEFSTLIGYDLKIVLRPFVNIRYPELCAVNDPFDVKVSNENAGSYKINAYYVGEKSGNNRRDSQKLYKKIIANDKPIISIDIENDKKAPFKEDSVVTVTLNRPGYYILVPIIQGEKVDFGYIEELRCVPILPITVNGADNMVQIFTVNSSTGAPVDGVNVTRVSRNKTVRLGRSDSDGIISYTSDKDRYNYGLTLEYEGKNYTFDDIGLNQNPGIKEDIIRNSSNVLTDRALYHPGEEVNVLGIFYESILRTDKSQQKNLLTDTNVGFVLHNANGQAVDTVKTTTDGFGRAIAKFTLPVDGLTGTFSVRTYLVDSHKTCTQANIMVSDYRMPDFELKITAVECDTPTKGAVTVSGEAESYSGMPVTDATLNMILRESAWWWRSSYGNTVYNAEFKTDETGKFSYVIPDSVFADKNAELFAIEIDAVSSTGSTATAYDTFSLTKKFFINVTIGQDNVDGSVPFRPEISVSAPDGSKVEIPLEWYLTKDKDTIASGTYYGSIDLSNITPGIYNISFKSVDPDLANVTYDMITIYNVASGVVPVKTLWVKENRLDFKDRNCIDVDFATGDDIHYVYYTLMAKDEILYSKLMKCDYGYHTLKIDLPKDQEEAVLKLISINSCKDYTHSISIYNKKDKDLRIEGESFRDNLVPGSSETWHLRIVNADGTPVTTAVAMDMYNKALEALRPHSFNINFGGVGFNSNFYYNTPRNATNSGNTVDKVDVDFTFELPYPVFNYYDNYNPCFSYFDSFLLSGGKGGRYVTGFYGSNLSYKMAHKGSLVDTEDAEFCVAAGAPMEPMMLSASADNVMYNTAPTSAAYDEMEEEAETDAGIVAQESFDYRDSDVPMAIWAPMLNTDAQGNVQYTFTVPNANTTWRLRAVAWTKDMEIGTMMRDFVASKPIMVQPNLPRFLRTGDTATVMASVLNNTDSVAQITTVVEIFNPFTSEIISTSSFSDTVDPKQSAKVSVGIRATDDLTAIGYRVRSTDGRFADGEQNVIRIMPSIQALIETTPFYLNPGETHYTTQLPAEKEARISLTFCENPAWSIVSALPGLRTQICEYANSAAAALYSAAVARGIIKENPHIGDALKAWSENPTDSALVSMLDKNEDLKIALLNSTPWVQAAQNDTERMANLQLIFDNAETDAAISSALRILEKLQKSDGGWSWGTWCDESSVWVTSNVLSMLGDLNRLGWLPENKSLGRMIERAVRYYDSKVEDTDLLYCLIRPSFNNIAISSNGKKVINATLNDIRKNWKKTMDPAHKCMEAEALYLNGDQPTALNLMTSVSEFGVYTPNQGLKFPSVNALYNYAIILEAYAMMLPDSKEVDGLRQQLIVRKQGTDWGDAVVTTEVVKSILSSGTRWTVDAKGAEVKAGGEVIEPNGPIETATGSMKADISRFAGEMLSITTTGVGPAYGAVYTQFSRQMEDVKASGCDDLDIEKQLYVRRGADWAIAEDLKVGDRVKVQLTIHCKRNLSYVSIVDERPATFEPVNQLPGWLWSEGVGFYRENRDSQTDLHVVYMRPGTYLLTYEMNVNIAGTFSSGVATIQSQYAPEISAHSSGTTITCTPSDSNN